jgi:hypothetical protein
MLMDCSAAKRVQHGQYRWVGSFPLFFLRESGFFLLFFLGDPRATNFKNTPNLKP